MRTTLNTAYPVAGVYREVWHATAIGVAGPVTTLLHAVLAHARLRAGATPSLFPFLLAPLYMRLMAGFMNWFQINDEGRASQALGLGTFTLPVLAVASLGWLATDAVRSRAVAGRVVVGTLALIIVVSSVIVLVDQKLRIILL